MDGFANRFAPAVFNDKGIGSGLQGLSAVGFIDAQHHDTHILVVVAQATGGFEPVHAIHMGVDKNQLGVMLLRKRQSLQAVVRLPLNRQVRIAAYRVSQATAYKGVVVGYQNRNRLHNVLCSS
jgi:hypothetical protein